MMESCSVKSHKRLAIQQALLESADLLCSYLQFANAHPVDFIVNDMWNTLLPVELQKELSLLTKDQLYKLPSGEGFSTDHAQLLSKEETSDLANAGDLLNHVKAISLCSEPLPNTRLRTAFEYPCEPWKQRSIQDFLTTIKRHCIDHLKCLDTSVPSHYSWLLGKDIQQGTGAPFVHAFMAEKKMHEVEIMADVCARIFHKTSCDVVVDLGSGKGYLSTQLSLQCQLPVLGIDSQPHNTSGAKRRADKLGRQWDSLVKHEERKSQGKDGRKTQGEQAGTALHNGDSVTLLHGESSISSKPSTSHLEVAEKSKTICGEKGSISEQSRLGDIDNQTEKSNPAETASETESNLESQMSTSYKNQDKKSNGEQNMSCANQSTQSNKGPAMNPSMDEQRHKLCPDQETNPPGMSQKLFTKCVALTTYVSADTKLADLVGDAADVLCLTKPQEDLRLLLTGLHTCGPLASNMLRLFVKDDSVQAVCGVGCCYQLMQERFSDESGSQHRLQGCEECCAGREETDGAVTDFPMSSALLQRKVRIGRKALDIASLALPRMTQSDGELQGRTFYPRALLQAFIHQKLGYVPKDLKRLRKLAKQATNPVDYVMRAIHKLNLSGCEATEEEVGAFHEQHRHQADKMAAFFQLRAALGPLVETVVLVDRLLFLLEQDCVEDASLVRLFDPVTSPRCHALVATKVHS